MRNYCLVIFVTNLLQEFIYVSEKMHDISSLHLKVYIVTHSSWWSCWRFLRVRRCHHHFLYILLCFALFSHALLTSLRAIAQSLWNIVRRTLACTSLYNIVYLQIYDSDTCLITDCEINNHLRCTWTTISIQINNRTKLMSDKINYIDSGNVKKSVRNVK